MAHWEKIPEIFAIGVAVLVFLSVYRKRQSVRTLYWIVGWVTVLLHFIVQAVAQFVHGPASQVLEFLAIASLIGAGALFFVSTAKVCEDAAKARIMAVIVVVPMTCYVALDMFLPNRYLMATATAVGFFSVLAFWYLYYSKDKVDSYLLLANLTISCTWIGMSVLSGNYDSGIVAALTALYIACGISYWGQYRRFSVGVVVASGGFLVWGAVFTVGSVLLDLYPERFEAGSAMWNVPKYFVVAAMILTLLEDETIFAERIARRYRQLFDRSLCGVFRCSAEGTVLDCNAAFSQIFRDINGVGLSANIGQLLIGSTGPNLLEQLREHGQVKGQEFSFAGLGGATRYVIGNAMLVTDAIDGSQEIEGVFLDISDFKALQDQIRDSQKLEALGQLAGGIAHDFNNLLMIISAHMELLEPDLIAAGASHRQLEAVKNATTRGAAITRELLTFSRKKPTELRKLDGNHLVHEARTLLQPAVGDSVQLEVKTPPHACDVVVDENQMTLVLLNLALNARDAMPNGGRLVIETSVVELDSSFASAHGLASSGNYFCISVSDTGSGMTPEIRARVFEPFFTTKPKGKGTGLGLPSCYGIVQQHGGSIVLASSPGIGTTVRIYLPCADNGQSKVQAQLSEAKAANASILLVDDEEMLRKPASLFLTSNGFQVIEASSGQEALELFANGSFDLVVTDMVMPGMTGKQLGAELKKRCPGLPIIYISGYAQDVLETQGHLSPDEILLEKPYSLKRLASLVENALGQKS